MYGNKEGTCLILGGELEGIFSYLQLSEKSISTICKICCLCFPDTFNVMDVCEEAWCTIYSDFDQIRLTSIVCEKEWCGESMCANTMCNSW